MRNWRRLLRVGLACVAAAAVATPWLFLSRPAAGQTPGLRQYLPVIYGPAAPAGVYDCVEYDSGVIWTTDVITLLTTGEAIYGYQPPSGGVMTGTWVYTPETRTLGFTEFRWESATFELTMDRLWAVRQVAPEYEIRLDCLVRWGP